jgi:hypothetical protein
LVGDAVVGARVVGEFEGALVGDELGALVGTVGDFEAVVGDSVVGLVVGLAVVGDSVGAFVGPDVVGFLVGNHKY